MLLIVDRPPVNVSQKCLLNSKLNRPESKAFPFIPSDHGFSRGKCYLFLHSLIHVQKFTVTNWVVALIFVI